MKRTYRQNCALALSSDILGERWTLLIIRELLIQPCRFKDLNSVLVGMGTNLLTNRLKEMEAIGLIERQVKTDKRSPYQLSPKGQEAEAIVLAMIRWGQGDIVQSQGQVDFMHHPHWDLLAMKALFIPELYRPQNPTLITVIQFHTDSFSGWSKVQAEGLSFGLGRYVSNEPVQCEPMQCEPMQCEKVIELAMTIADLQQILITDGKEKKELLSQEPALAEVIVCFNPLS